MMQGVSDADYDVEISEEPLRSQDLKCPVCQAVHSPEEEEEFLADNDGDGDDDVRRVYPGAMLVYVQTKCPICWNEEAGPPIVALPCGHAICPEDYQRLGGRLPGHNNHDPNHPNHANNRSSSSGRMGRWRLDRSDALLRSAIVMGTTNADLLRQEMMQHMNDDSSDSASSSSDDEPYTDEHVTTSSSDSDDDDDDRRQHRMRPLGVPTRESQENEDDSDVPPLVPRFGRRLPSSEWTRHRDTEEEDCDVCDVPPLVQRRSVVQDDPLDHPDGWPQHGHANDDSDDGTSRSSSSRSIIAVEDPPQWRPSGLRDPEASSSDNDDNECDA
eukprot:scaffold13014_cov57-Attheya_sp.AAC.6